MDRTLYVGFKGNRNASCVLAQSISKNHFLLTNSFSGIERDMERLPSSFDRIILLGIDKRLKNAVRIEEAAEKDTREFSALPLEEIVQRLENSGIPCKISSTPTQYLCNEAYWFILRKYSGQAVLLHIPTFKNMDERFLERITLALR